MADPTWDESQPIQVAANTPQDAPTWDESEPVEKSQSPFEMYKAGVEGLERGMTRGVSDFYRTHVESPIGKFLGLPDSMVTTKEDLARRKAANPELETAANMAGTAVSTVVAGMGGGIPALALEGATIGAGNVLSEYSLGDPELTASKAMWEIGLGAALGGGLGVLGKGLEAGIPALKNALKSIRGSSEALENAPASAAMGAKNIVPQEETVGVIRPKFQDLEEKVKQAAYSGETFARPELAPLDDAISRVEMQNPVHELQRNALTSDEAWDGYRRAKEMSEAGGVLKNYEGMQKNELVSKTNTAIKDLSPGVEPVSDAIEGGNRAIDIFKKNYKESQELFGNAIQKLKETKITTPNKLTDIVAKMSDDLPSVANVFDTSGKAIEMKPYNGGMGISQKAYSAIKDVVRDIKANPKADFETLQSIRNRIAEHGDVLEHSAVAGELRTLRKSMMDYMQERIQKTVPDQAVRDVFKGYAINEQEREVIERAFGASVGSPEFGAISKIKPEVIGDRIFANSASVNAAKNILEPKQFNEILANWISEAKSAATDKGAFSSNKFASWMRRNQDALNVAFKENPAQLQRLKDLTTIMRILPDSPSINPSGTAKTLLGALKGVHSVTDLAGAVGKIIKEKTLDKINEQVAMANLNNQLAGKAANATMMSELGKMVTKANDAIGGGAKAIFRGDFNRGAALSGGLRVIDSQYDKKADQVRKHASNPQEFMDHIAQNTEALHSAAPQVAQGISNAMARSVQFLASKLPVPQHELPLSHDWEPTVSQKRKFLRYYAAVENPVMALKEIKEGVLSNETMEAINAVHPDMLKEMQNKVMEQIQEGTHKKISYGTKVALSKFLGQPMDAGMIPQNIMANQAAFQLPSHNEGQVKPTSKGMREMKSSSLAATRTQQLEKSDA